MPFPSHFSSVVFLSLPNLCVQISSMRTSYLQSSVPRYAALITHISVLSKKNSPDMIEGSLAKLTNGAVKLYFYWMTQSQLLISRKAPSAGNPDQDQNDCDFDALHASNPVDFTFKLHSWMSGLALGSTLLFCLLGPSEHPAGSFCPAFCINSCLLVMCYSVRESL